MHYWDGEGAFVRDGIRQAPISIICMTCSSRKKDWFQTIYVCAKVSVCECKFQLSNAVHGVTLSSRWNVPWNRYRDTPLKWFSLSKPKKLRTASWNLFWLQANATTYFYLLVSNSNLTLLFFTHEWLQLKLTNQWLLFTQSINKQEANLAVDYE